MLEVTTKKKVSKCLQLFSVHVRESTLWYREIFLLSKAILKYNVAINTAVYCISFYQIELNTWYINKYINT